jgi:hypothetical protein
MGMKKIGGRLLLVGTWKVPGKFGGKGLRKVLGYGLCKVAGVCGRVKCVESAWKVCGKFEGMGVESCGGGKFVESALLCVWNVRGKLEGVGVRKFIAGTWGKGAVQS